MIPKLQKTLPTRPPELPRVPQPPPTPPETTALPPPGTVFRDVDAPWCPEMVVVPAGTFLMGSPDDEEGRDRNEGPQHRVAIAKPFAIGKFPVTFAEYDYFCEQTSRDKPSDSGAGRNRRPVINVSWEDAQEYVAWLSQKTGKLYRLPTEAEWEYACRAGTTTRFAFGNKLWPTDATIAPSVLSALARLFQSPKTTEVGKHRSNAWGLYDMHGNVWEWCEDCWHDSYHGAPDDGRAWGGEDGGDCDRRVLRGGSRAPPTTSRARPTASGTPRATGSTSSGFVWCVRPHLLGTDS
ncbi:MAG: formylglycine-generating enzyme family protein [Rhodospirillales bacterium]|nr:MAG: formylglycine-generating enzyme family protein [Rhodospirillales bacterium]